MQGSCERPWRVLGQKERMNLSNALFVQLDPWAFCSIEKAEVASERNAEFITHFLSALLRMPMALCCLCCWTPSPAWHEAGDGGVHGSSHWLSECCKRLEEVKHQSLKRCVSARSSATPLSYQRAIKENKNPTLCRRRKCDCFLAFLVAPVIKYHPRHPKCMTSANGKLGLFITWLLKRCLPGEWPWHTLSE